MFLKIACVFNAFKLNSILSSLRKFTVYRNPEENPFVIWTTTQLEDKHPFIMLLLLSGQSLNWESIKSRLWLGLSSNCALDFSMFLFNSFLYYVHQVSTRNINFQCALFTVLTRYLFNSWTLMVITMTGVRTVLVNMLFELISSSRPFNAQIAQESNRCLQLSFLFLSSGSL